MELNHRLLHVGQVSLPFDYEIVSSVTEVGIEPAISYYRGPSLHPPYQSAAGPCWHLDLAAFPVCVPGRLCWFEKWRVRESHPAFRAYEAPNGHWPTRIDPCGIRTHSIHGSKPRWSASCLPSHIHAGAQSEIRTHNHSILSRVALPIGVSRRGNEVIPDGLEPSFSGCKPGVVATGPRDQD